MKKRIYLARANHKKANHENQTNASGEKQNHQMTGQGKEQLLEISGSEFYRIVSDLEGERRYFIRLTDDLDFECAEILSEVPREEYLVWKKENNRYLYQRQLKSYYAEVPFDDALLFLCMEQSNEPEHLFEKRENLIRLQNAFASLTEEEKELIWLLYLCKEPLTETQVASVLHISQPAVHKEKNFRKTPIYYEYIDTPDRIRLISKALRLDCTIDCTQEPAILILDVFEIEKSNLFDEIHVKFFSHTSYYEDEYAATGESIRIYLNSNCWHDMKNYRNGITQKPANWNSCFAGRKVNMETSTFEI